MVFMLTIIVDKHTKDSQWELEINVAAIWSKTKTIKPTGDLIWRWSWIRSDKITKIPVHADGDLYLS